MPTQKLRVERMRPGDEGPIAGALSAMEGVIFAVASHADLCVEVEFEDDCVTIDEVAETLSRLGFPATPVG
jgi:hypothetical protein